MILSLAEDFVVFSIYIQLLQFGFSSPGLSILLGLGHIIITPPPDTFIVVLVGFHGTEKNRGVHFISTFYASPAPTSLWDFL